MKQNKYSNLQGKAGIPFVPKDVPLILNFKGTKRGFHKIDLTFFVVGNHPRPLIANACAQICWLEMPRYSTASRLALKEALRTFNRFLNWRADGISGMHINTTLEIKSSLFVEFRAFLEIIYQGTSSAHSKYHLISRFFTIMQAVRPEFLCPDLKIPPNPFSSQVKKHSVTDNILSFSDCLLIAEAAKREVRQIRENHQRAVKFLESAAANDAQARLKPKPEGFWKSAANTLYYMVRVEGMTTISDNTRHQIRANGYPTPAKFIAWYAPTSEEYFIPFLILIFLNTAINVTSIFSLKRDCLGECPLPLNLTTLKFHKSRSGRQANKELYFPTNLPNGAVSLIQFLLEYTRPWIEYVSREEKDSLFLYYCSQKQAISAGEGFGAVGLERFIARNNLPHFSFEQLRPTVATMIYLQTRDIFRVQRLLNHSSITTTLRYIKGPIQHARHNRQMAEGIDAMVESVTGIKHREGDIEVFSKPVAEVIAVKVTANELTPEAGEQILKGGCRTLVGRCRDPLNSPQPNEVRGRVCRSLHACIFCENCWIFAEDLVDTIKYRNSLEEDKSHLTSAVWNELHGDAVREINEAILPSFPLELVAQAELKAKQI